MKASQKGRSFINWRDISKIGTFAKEALDVLKDQCPGTLASALVRVDVMQRKDGSFVVNEFESFEAQYASSANKEMIIESSIRSFWHSVIDELLEKTMCSKKTRIALS